MRTDDIFITDHEIEEAFSFISGLEVDSNPAIHALGKMFIANDNTMNTISRSALQSLTLQPTPLILLATCFYIIGLNTGLRRAETSSLESLINLASPSPKKAEESK